MDNTAYIKEHFNQLQQNGGSSLKDLREKAFHSFSKLGIPTSRHEEWKYTRIGSLFNKPFLFPAVQPTTALTPADIDQFRLPGREKAHELVFVNGIYSPTLSSIHIDELVVTPLEDAAKNEYSEKVSKHLGHSANYLKDGIHSLNTAFVYGGVFVFVKRGKIVQYPLYIYHITDTRIDTILSQPRSLVYISENAQLQIVETFASIGNGESFTSQVMEIVLEKDARLEHYKIQNDSSQNSQVSTTHIRHIGKSYSHAVTISLNGGIVRNNTNMVLEADHAEAHLYGLYFQGGQSHIDNHTVVDNVKPNCYSNELYKGIMTDSATGVFNGKIFVRQDAQKTNAYQSNKNILLSGSASVNTKPQLEIFADDVKCSHGCTVGQLDEEGLFYLRSRGVPEKMAISLLLHGFAMDILEEIKLPAIRDYVDQLISTRLEFDIS